MTVNSGPAAANGVLNIPYASVTVCIHGTTTCQTVTDVLVDIGSSGLRLMASTLGSLALPEQADPVTAGNTIAECLPFADGYTWGPVATADVTIGGETASSVPINIIDDKAGFFPPAVPADCTSNGTPLSSVSSLGANGILGVGLVTQDCGTGCNVPASEQNSPYFYFTCTPGTAGTCTVANEPVTSQVTNPVALFPVDNNGVILQLPAIPVTGATTASGYLVFGIGTETNNKLGSATVLTLSSADMTFSTQYKGSTLDYSFLDSGSNGLFFPDSSIALCGSSAPQDEFFCPPSTLSLTAVNTGANGAVSTVDFQIANLNDLPTADAASDAIGGPATAIQPYGTDYFDFGLPFFYGKTVFTAIEGVEADGTLGPYYAY